MNKTTIIALLSVLALCTLAVLPAAAATRGNTLITDDCAYRVFEVDADGNIVWEANRTTISLDFCPTEADRLANGNTLIVDRRIGTTDRVIEVDTDGNIVWEVNSPKDMSLERDVDRLANGNTLVTMSGKCHTFEVDSTGNIIWELNISTTPGFTDRAQHVEGLPNGNILLTVGNHNKVIEVDPITKNLVWEINETTTFWGKWVYDAERLPNGNTIVSDADETNDVYRIIEVDPTGNIVWELNSTTTPGLCCPCEFDVLPDGNLLIVDYNDWNEPRVIEVDSAGNIVWEINETIAEGTGPWETWGWIMDADRILPPTPDLVPTAITAPALLPDEPNTITATIENIGTADAGSFNVSLSADGNVVDTASVVLLGIGNTTNVSFEWTPASVGEVDLCVVADSDGTVDELNETNNDKCVVVTVPAPDLVPAAMTPDAFFPGKPNTVTATIESTGDADAGSFNVALSVDGAEIDTASVDGLADGASTEVSFSWTAAVGDHELCVLADSDSEVDESDETNNELCKDVTVYPNTVYLVPKDSGAPYCCEAEVEVWVEAADGFQGGQINLTYSADCANVTGVEFNPVWDFESATWWDTYEGYTRISFAKSEGMVSGDVWIGNLMIQCTSEDIDTLCSTMLSYAPTTKLVNDFGTEVKANLIEGTFGCEIPASVIKGDAISDLEAISTTNKHSQKEIDEAIKQISSSLDAALWTGAARLDPKHGHKVFDDEKKAVKHLMKITEEKGEHADPAIVGDVEAVIAKLTEADEQLAVVAINDAKNTPVQDAKKVDEEIAKAEDELDKARQELANDKPDKAIDHFKLAWEHAQQAIKHAEG